MNTPFGERRVVVLSPHLDDAALSCGALIADSVAAGSTVTVMTVFDGSPSQLSSAAEEFLHRCGLGPDGMDVRRAEDDNAMALLGASTVRLGLSEALFRRGDDGVPVYPDGQDIFTAVEEPLVLAEVAERLRDGCATAEADIVLCPVGIGGHADHRIVTEAARLVVEDRSRLWCYEDIPYVLYSRCATWRDQHEVAESLAVQVSDAAWAVKLEALASYRSQHVVLWHDPVEWAEELGSYARVAGGGVLAERLWRTR